MTAIVSGSGVGVLNSSMAVLGQAGLSGMVSKGNPKESAALNIVNGNLSIRERDVFLASEIADLALTRSYNSQGRLSDGSGGAWKAGLLKRIGDATGEMMRVGSTVTRYDGDGSASIFSFDQTRGLYISTNGGGAYATLAMTDGQEWVWRDANGQAASFEKYDASKGGRISASGDAHGLRLQYHYNSLGQVSSIADINGDVMHLEYNRAGSVAQIKMVKAAGKGDSVRVRYHYDGQDRLRLVATDILQAADSNTPAKGGSYATAYSYDGASERIAVIAQSDGTRLSFSYLRAGDSWKVSSFTDSAGATATVDYLSSDTTRVRDALGNKNLYRYDSKGQLLSVTSEAADGNHVLAAFEYDNLGNVRQSTDAQNVVRKFEYDGAGNQIVERGGDDALHVQRQFSAGGNLMLSEAKYAAGSKVAATTYFAYDQTARLRFSVQPDGVVYERRYDGLGRLASELAYVGSRFAAGINSTVENLELWLSAGDVDRSNVERRDHSYDARGLLVKTTSYMPNANSAILANVNLDWPETAGLQTTATNLYFVYDQAGRLLQTLGDVAAPVIVANSPSGDAIAAYDGTTTSAVVAETSSSKAVLAFSGTESTSTLLDASDTTLMVLSESAPTVATPKSKSKQTSAASLSAPTTMAMVGGTSSNDTLNGTAEDDVLNGYGGDDVISGLAGNDTITGGTGNDNMNGAAGNDVYVFSRGDGVDMVSDTDSTAGNTDVVRFVDVASTEVNALERYASKLTIKYGDGDQLDILGYFNAGSLIEEIQFSDGVTWNLGTVQSKVITYGTNTGDSIYGAIDQANRMYGLDGNDMLSSGNVADTLDGGAGNDSLYGYGGDDILYGGIGDDVIDPGTGDDTIYGGEGNDNIYGSAGNDVLIGGKGSDILDGGAGSDIYRFWKGDGVDAISNADSGTGRIDTIEFMDINQGDITGFKRIGSMIYINYGVSDQINLAAHQEAYFRINKIVFQDAVWDSAAIFAKLKTMGFDSNDTITGYQDAPNNLYGYGGDDVIWGSSYSNSVDYIEAGDGNDAAWGAGGDDTLYGGAGIDRLYGNEGNDTLIGGKGNDHIDGNTGDDTYQFSVGDGNDTVQDYTSTGPNSDRLVFNGIHSADVKFERFGDNLIIRYGTSDSVTVLNHFMLAMDYYSRIDYVKFADLQYDAAAINAITVTVGTNRADTISGYTDGGNILEGGSDNDTLSGQSFNDSIKGGAGQDNLYAKDGHDLLVGGTGDDHLEGGNGNDTYVFSKGDGKDYIWDWETNGVANTDRIRFTNVFANEVRYERRASALVIIYGATDEITVEGFYQGDYNTYQTNDARARRIEILEFADGSTIAPSEIARLTVTVGGGSFVGYSDGDNNIRLVNETKDEVRGSEFNDTISTGRGNDTIWGRNGNDKIIGGAGSDTLTGGFGNDIFEFSIGDGSDYITSDEADNGYNTIRLLGVRSTDFMTPIEGKISLYYAVLLNRKPDTAGLAFWTERFSSGLYTSDFIANEILNSAEAQAIYSTGIVNTDFVRALYLTALNREPSTSEINSLLGWGASRGGAVNSFLSQINTLADSKYWRQRQKTLEYSPNLLYAGGYLEIRYGLSDVIRVDSQFGTNPVIDALEFSDGVVWNLAEMAKPSHLPNSYAISITQLPGQSGQMQGGLGADTLRGAELTDSINGDDGGDNLYGLGGDDNLNGDAGDDRIEGGDGNDTVAGGTGADTLIDTQGDDKYLFSKGDGVDTITDTAGANDTVEFTNVALSDLISPIYADINRLYFTLFNRESDLPGLSYWADRLNSATGLADLAQQFLESPEGKLMFPEQSNRTKLITQFYQNALGRAASQAELSSFAAAASETNGEAVIRFLEKIKDHAEWVAAVDSVKHYAFSRTYSDDLVIQYGPADQLTILGYFTAANHVENIKFSDVTLTKSLIKEYVISAPGYSNVTFADVKNRVYGSASDNYINGGTLADTIYGNAGNDTLRGLAGEDVLVGGAGTDNLYGGEGADTYKFAVGDGSDIITDDDPVAGIGDTIEFTNIASTAFNGAVAEVSKLYLALLNRLPEPFAIAYWKSQFVGRTPTQIADLILATGEAKNLFPHEATNSAVVNQVFRNLLARDATAAESEMYRKQLAGGMQSRGQVAINIMDDLILPADLAKVESRLSLGQTGPTFYRSGANLIIVYGGSDKITVYDHFGTGRNRIENFKFSDGVTWDHSSIMPSLFIEGTQGNDTLNGLDTAKDRLFGLDGHDTLNGNALNDYLDGGLGEDTLNGGTGDDTLIGGIGEDTLNGGAGNDTYRFIRGEGRDNVNEDSPAATSFDTLEFVDVAYSDLVSPNQTTVAKLYYALLNRDPTPMELEYWAAAQAPAYSMAGFAEMIISNAEAQKNLPASDLTDVFISKLVYQILDRQVSSAELQSFMEYAREERPSRGALAAHIIGVIDAYTATDNATWRTKLSQTVFAGPFRRVGNALHVYYGAGDVVEVKAYFSGTNYEVEQFKFRDGVVLARADVEAMVYVVGTDNADSPASYWTNRAYGLGHNDYLVGGSADDILDGGEGTDTLSGAGGNDLLVGGAGDDAITGGLGNDRIYGGAGNDTMSGDEGSDTYFINRGFGNDTIYNTDSGPTRRDILKFATGIAQEEIKVKREEYDLIVSVPTFAGSTTFDTLRIKNWFHGSNYKLNEFVFWDGRILSTAEIESMLNTINGDENANTIVGGPENTRINGKGGDDKITDNGGSDIIHGDDGDDLIRDFGTGENELYGDRGNDTIEYDGLAKNSVFGGAGDDTILVHNPTAAGINLKANLLNGGRGNDRFFSGSSIDTYLFDRGDGSDSILENGAESSGGIDTIQFGPDIKSEHISVVRPSPTSMDLVLEIAGAGFGSTADQITIEKWFEHDKHKIEQFAFADGTMLTAAQLIDKMLMQENAITDLGLIDVPQASMAMPGMFGSGGVGEAGDLLHVNSLNGNLVVQGTHSFLATTGIDLRAALTYNSKAKIEAGGSLWQLNLAKSLSRNVDGNFVRTNGDGSETVYSKVTQNLYRTFAGTGAYDTIQFDSNRHNWVWVDGDTRATERYSADKLLIIAATDHNANVAEYEYDEDDRLSSINSANGEKMKFIYNGADQLASIQTQREKAGGGTQNSTRVHYAYSGGQLTDVSIDLTPDDGVIDSKAYKIKYEYYAGTNRIQYMSQSDGTRLEVKYEEVTGPNGGWWVSEISDSLGHLSTVTREGGATIVSDPSGRQVSYKYDTDNRLESITDLASNQVTLFTYNAKGDIETIVAPDLATTEFEYDRAGNQISQVVENAQQIVRTFAKPGLVSTETVYAMSPLGGTGSGVAMTTRNVYEIIQSDELPAPGTVQDRLRFRISAEGRVTEWLYNDDGSVKATIQYTDCVFDVGGAYDDSSVPPLSDLLSWLEAIDKSASIRKELVYDTRGLLKQAITFNRLGADGEGVLDGLETVEDFTYDHEGKLLASTDAAGLMRTFTYDGMGRAEIEVDGIYKTTSVTVYSASGRVVTASGRDLSDSSKNLTTRSVFDTAGRLLTRSITTDAVAEVVNYTYDSAGRVRSVERANGSIGYVFYDNSGRKAIEFDGDGSVTEYKYNRNSQVSTVIRRATPMDVIAQISSLNKTLSTVKAEDLVVAADVLKDETEYFGYDRLGRLTKRVDARGYMSQTFYDGQSRQVGTRRYATAVVVTDPENIPAENGGPNDRVTRTFYDDDGFLIAKVDEEGYLTLYTNNAAGQLTERYRFAVASALADLQSASLQQLMVKETESEAEQAVHEYFYYGAKGELRAQLDGEGYLTVHEYDSHENITLKTRFNSEISVTEDLDLEALLAFTDDDNQSASYQFNSRRQLTAETAANGKISTYEYDALGNLYATHSGVGTADLRETVLKVDARGFVIADLVGENAGTTHQYNSAGQRISTTDIFNNITTYVYDKDGRVRTTIDGDGGATSTEYDGLNRLKKVSRIFERATTRDGVVVRNLDKDIVTSYTYEKGLLKSLSDQSGMHTFDYNEFGEVSERKDILNATQTALRKFSYSKRGELKTTSDLVNGRFENEAVNYNALGLVSSRELGNKLTTFKYDRLGRQIQINHPLGPTGANDASMPSSTTVYDAFDRVTHFTEGANAIEYSYDNDSRTMTMTTSEGVKQIIVSNVHGQQHEVIDAYGNKTTYLYDSNGKLDVVKNALNEEILDNDYDTGGRLSSSTDGNQVKTEYKYDKANRVFSRTVDTAGQKLVTTFEYDGIGQSLKITSPANVISITEYDANGNVEFTVEDFGGSGHLNLKTIFEYDAAGRSVVVTEPGGRTTRYSYDELGRRISETVDPSVDDVAGLSLTTSYTYDVAGNLATSTNANDQVTRNFYDEQNRLVFTIGPDGAVSSTSYNENGKVKSTTRYAKFFASSSAATLDNLNSWVLTAKDANRDQSTQLFYDADNRVRLKIEGTGAATRVDYDLNGRVVRTTAYAKAVGDISTLQEFDSVVELDQADRVTTNVYDSLGRVYKAIEAGGGTTFYRYDGNGNVISAVLTDTVSEAILSARWMSYDSSNRVVSTAITKDVDGADTSWSVIAQQYDKAGNVSRRTAYATVVHGDPSLHSPPAGMLTVSADPTHDIDTHFAYDKANRLVGKAAAQEGEGGVLWNLAAYRYDPAGNLLANIQFASAYSGAGAELAEAAATLAPTALDRQTRMVYDQAGRLEFTVDALGTVMQFVRDAMGNIETETVHSAAIDVSGSLTAQTILSGMEASDVPNRVATFDYDSAGRQVYQKDSTGKVSITRYDGLSNIVRTTVSADGESRVRDYAYDTDSRLQYVIDEMGFVTKKSFDALGQLVDVTQFETAVAKASTDEPLSAADAKNLLNARSISLNEADRFSKFTYDAGGRVVSVTDAYDHTEKYEYDAAGHKTKFTNKLGKVWTYEYDSAGRLVAENSPLIKVTGDGVEGASPISLRNGFRYDSFGNLVARIEAEGIAGYERRTDYHYDLMGRQIATLLPAVKVYPPNLPEGVLARSVTRVFYDAFGNAVMNNENGNVSRKVYDSMGNETHQIDALGFVTHYKYDAFGDRVEVVRHVNSLHSVPGFDESTFQFTKANVEATIKYDAKDRKIEMHYDELGRVKKILEGEELHSVSLDSSANMRRAVENEYNGFGELKAQRTFGYKVGVAVPVLGAMASFEYNLRGEKVSEYRQAGVGGGYLTTTDYDVSGNVVEIVEYSSMKAEGAESGAVGAKDRKITYTFDKENRKTEELKENAGVDTLAVTPENAMTVVRDAANIKTSYKYDFIGRLTTVTDAAFNVSETGYDDLGRVIEKRERTSASNEKHLVTTYSLNAHGDAEVEIVKSLDGTTPNRTTKFKRNLNGQVEKVIDAASKESHIEYDIHGQVKKEWRNVTDTAFGVIPSDSVLPEDATTRVVWKTYEYDAVGRLASTTTPGAIEPTVSLNSTPITHSKHYSAFGELIATKVNGNDYEFADYDSLGRVWRTNAGDGVTKVMLYDLNDQVASLIRSTGAVFKLGSYTTLAAAYAAITEAAEDSGLVREDSSFNMLGHLTGTKGAAILVENAAGTGTMLARATTTQVSDRWGNVLEIKDARNPNWSMRYQYNVFNQRIHEEQHLAVSSGQAITGLSPTSSIDTYFDAAGRKIATRDGRGHINGTVYDNAGNIEREVHADGGEVKYEYNTFGEKTKSSILVSAGNYRSTEFAYDQMGRLKTTTSDSVISYVAVVEAGSDDMRSVPLNAQTITETYYYDELGQRVAVVNGLNEVEQFAYDLEGNVRETYIDLKTKDKFGNSGLRKTMGYDAFHNKILEHYQNTQYVRYSYDYFGNMQSQTEMSGRKTQFVYDEMMKLKKQYTEVSVAGQHDQNTTYTYQGGLVIKIEDAKAASDSREAQVTTYAYDLAGQRVREQSQLIGSGVFVQNNVIKYDQYGRVKRVTDGVFDISYEYDENGNRVNVNSTYTDDSGSVVTSNVVNSFDSMDRQLLVNADSGGVTPILGNGGHAITYNLAGERTSDTYIYKPQATSAVQTVEEYRYDAIGRLTRTIRDGVGVDRRDYDAAGRIVRSGVPDSWSDDVKPTSDKLKDFGIDANNWVARYDGAGRVLRQKYRDMADGQLEDIYFHALNDHPNDNAKVGYDSAGNLWGYYVVPPMTLPGAQYIHTFDFHTSTVWKETRATVTRGNDTSSVLKGYDRNGNLGSIAKQYGQFTQTMYYDPSGRLLLKDANGKQTRSLVVNGEVLGTNMTAVPDGIAPEFGSTYEPTGSTDYGQVSSTYVVRDSDSLTSIAKAVWGDANLWYLIADANALSLDSVLVAGQILRIPARVNTVHNDYATFKPYDLSAYIGDNTPTLAPPVPFDKSCPIVGPTVATIVKLVAQYYFRLPAPVAAMLANAAGQVAGRWAGERPDFNWKEVGVAGLASSIAPENPVYDWKDAAYNAAVSNITYQGVAIAANVQKKFDWRGVVVSYASAGLGHQVSTYIGGSAQAKAFTNEFTRGTASGTAMSLIKGGKLRFGLVAFDAFGNALGSSIAESVGGGTSSEIDGIISPEEIAQNRMDDETEHQRFVHELDANVQANILRSPELPSEVFEMPPFSVAPPSQSDRLIGIKRNILVDLAIEESRTSSLTSPEYIKVGAANIGRRGPSYVMVRNNSWDGALNLAADPFGIIGELPMFQGALDKLGRIQAEKHVNMMRDGLTKLGVKDLPPNASYINAAGGGMDVRGTVEALGRAYEGHVRDTRLKATWGADYQTLRLGKSGMTPLEFEKHVLDLQMRAMDAAYAAGVSEIAAKTLVVKDGQYARTLGTYIDDKVRDQLRNFAKAEGLDDNTTSKTLAVNRQIRSSNVPGFGVPDGRLGHNLFFDTTLERKNGYTPQITKWNEIRPGSHFLIMRPTELGGAYALPQQSIQPFVPAARIHGRR